MKETERNIIIESSVPVKIVHIVFELLINYGFFQYSRKNSLVGIVGTNVFSIVAIITLYILGLACNCLKMFFTGIVYLLLSDSISVLKIFAISMKFSLVIMKLFTIVGQLKIQEKTCIQKDSYKNKS